MKEILMWETLQFTQGVGFERFNSSQLKEMETGVKYLILQ